MGTPNTLSIIFRLNEDDKFFNHFKEIIHHNFFVTNFLELYKPIKKIGKGTFALVIILIFFMYTLKTIDFIKVYLFEEKATGKKVAVKTFNKEYAFSKFNGKVKHV